jgi:hypothetical protein
MLIKNTFTSGMSSDSLETLSNPDTYRMARNAIHQSREASGFGLVNEESNEMVASFGGTIVGHSYIEERNQTLFFVDNGSSELWLFNHDDNSTTFVCSDAEFGCTWGFAGCELLYGEFKQFNNCNELHVYWSSDCIYHVVNIDEMLAPARKAAVIACEDCTYFDVFKATCGPHMSALPSFNTGSTLEAGVVQFAVQFKDNDGNTSNVFDISQPVYIESEDNTPGQVATMSAKLRIDSLDKTWNDVIIYVVHTVGQITTIRKMPSSAYGDKGFTFEYYGQEGELVDVAVLLNKDKAWLRGQDLIQKDGRMFFYNLKNERNLNYQKDANNITVEWVEWEVSMEQQLKYNYPSLLRGEVYAIGIVWKYLDGTYSDVFHIPAGGGSTGAGGDGGGGSTTTGSDGTGGSGGGSTGGTANGGGEIDGGAADSYKPMEVSDFDTEEQFDRKRNPTEVKDRPNESDVFEEQTRADIDNIETREEDYVESAECLACTRECMCCECADPDCDCSVLPKVVEQDIHDISNTEQNNAEILAGFGKDFPDPPVNTTGNLHDAAVKLVDDSVIEREYITRKRPVLNYTGANQSGPGKAPEVAKSDPLRRTTRFTQKGVGVSNIEVPIPEDIASIRGDNWVDSIGNNMTEEPPRVIEVGEPEVWESVIEYPDHKDCDGNFFYPQTTIKHHRIPWTSERPHFVSYQNGVVNKYQPENYEYGKTYTRPMGLRLSNIKYPDQDELPKPLCLKSPFKLVYVQRTDQNKTIFAKGWMNGIFEGDVYGSNYAYPRHGVNSFEHVDRMVSSGDGSSRLGTQSDLPIYNFHSPDTDCDNSFLPVTKVKGELELLGNGWKHGQYSEGRKPKDDQWSGTQIDNRGTRVSNNLNHYTQNETETDIVGISYAPSNTVVTQASEMQLPLMNRFRESSVYLETETVVPGADRDQSFVGDVMDHFCPTKANAPYVALYRELEDQYGSVEGLKYIDLGIMATQVHAQGNNSIEGICGDTWIAPYSKKRTSYVSNKQGDFFDPPSKPGSPCRQRSWCDSPDDKLFQYMGIDHYPTKVPKSGDLWDPKNYAGLHTVAGECGALGLSRTCADAAGIGASETDYYWPRTLKSLVHCVTESHVNPWLRETGEGSQIHEGKVWYPKLKDLYLDADAPSTHPWEESYLSRFYCAIEQPSKKQLAKKALIRTVLNLIIPAGMLTQFQNMETVIDTVSTFMVAPMLMALWVLAVNTLFTDRRLNQMLGIGDCKRDEEGGDLDECIENFEDAFCRYNWDYSRVNDVQPYYAFPLPYNTCDCDSCNKLETNNEIYHSNKQNLDSEIDAYRNIKINNYNELPSHAGKLQRLFIQGNGFYAHTTDGIWLLKLAQETLSGGIAFQQSGSGELLAEPQLLFEGVQEGFAGTEDPNAGINTAYGYFFIDRNARKIYRFNGSPEEISNYGMHHFFKENLHYCEPSTCYDEKKDGGVYFSLGWDPRHNRLLVTKRDGSDCSSWTASYTPIGIPTQGGGARGKWISFHDYIPSDYLWDRNNFYSLIHGSGEVWKHHVKADYQTFYGEKHPFEIWFTAVNADLEAFDFEYLELDTEAELDTDKKYPKKGLDETFNKVAVWNSFQGTGTIPIEFISDNFGKRNSAQDLIKSDYGKVRYNKVRSVWRANAIKDLVLDSCKDDHLLISDCECQIIPDVNEEIFDCTTIKKQDFQNRILSDNHLNFRYTLDDPDKTDMRLYVKWQSTFDDKKKIPK